MTDKPSRLDLFRRAELRVGRIVSVKPFPEARKPAYQLRVGFGAGAECSSSAQLPGHYPDPSSLQDTQVVVVSNFAPRKVAGFRSEVLTTGMYGSDGHVRLARPIQPVPDGSRISTYPGGGGPESTSTIITIDEYAQGAPRKGTVIGMHEDHVILRILSLDHAPVKCACDADALFEVGQALLYVPDPDDCSRGHLIGARRDSTSPFTAITCDDHACIPDGSELF
jgi:tRNA-binding protein